MAVGIVRRIDELGRIVIPKEMRKTMRLQVGDEMEISANDEGLTLKRYTGFQSVLPSLKALAKALASATGKDVLILSASEVVLCEGIKSFALSQRRSPTLFAEGRRLTERG